MNHFTYTGRIEQKGPRILPYDAMSAPVKQSITCFRALYVMNTIQLSTTHYNYFGENSNIRKGYTDPVERMNSFLAGSLAEGD